MENKLAIFIKTSESEKFATTNGKLMHAKLQHVHLEPTPTGDPDLIKKIMESDPKLQYFFGKNSKTEVPIAGFIKEQFISRRIDRLVIDNANKTVHILDYKTDTDKKTFRNKYIAQLQEYAELLKQIYRGYKISCHILWLHDWTLEQIIKK